LEGPILKSSTHIEDGERAKLKSLAETLKWGHSLGDPEIIMGPFNEKPMTVGIDRSLFDVQVLYFMSRTVPELSGTIAKNEASAILGIKGLRKVLKPLGSPKLCEIKVGDEFLDNHFCFYFNERNAERFKNYMADNTAREIFKELLSFCDNMTFEFSGVICYKRIEKGDLDLENVKAKVTLLLSLSKVPKLYID
jgi:hypothetical protein